MSGIIRSSARHDHPSQAISIEIGWEHIVCAIEELHDAYDTQLVVQAQVRLHAAFVPTDQIIKNAVTARVARRALRHSPAEL
jgi:hypothetical protein